MELPYINRNLLRELHYINGTILRYWKLVKLTELHNSMCTVIILL